LKGDNILVTGGAGFIGSHVVDRLMDEGCKVTVLDNLSAGAMENIRQQMGKESFNFIKGDVRDEAAVREAVRGVDAVIHLAALISVEESVKQPLTYRQVNVAGTVNLLKAAVGGGVRRFIYVSSTAVYGEPEALPLREEYSTHPLSPYAESKLAGEQYCQAYHNNHDLSTAVLRLFNVYGPRQRQGSYGGVITRFVNSGLGGKALTIYGDGEQTRDFIYVGDVVEAIIHAVECEDAEGETLNICTGKPTSINQLALDVKTLLGKNLETRYAQARVGDIKHSYGDPGKAVRVLGFKAKMSLRNGLEELVGCLRNVE